MPTLNPAAYSQILDNLPHVVMRLVNDGDAWNATYVNKAVEQYGYSQDDFVSGRMTWNTLLHPNDRVMAVKICGDYMKKEIDDFKQQYRIATRDGASIYVTEYSHVNRDAAGKRESVDTFLLENLEAHSSDASATEEALGRHLALNDILLTVQDAKNVPENAIQFILDRVGALLGCSRALLFKDSPDHKTCKVAYEWHNHGIASVKELDRAIAYSTAMPEVYTALQETGVLLVNAGEIPENRKGEFEAEGLLSSAIFAIYQYGDHYGFVRFDDCVVERRWDPDTANFLKVVANLLSNVIMNLQSDQYLIEYENKIKTLAFRDYQTGLPNHYPFDSDLADLIVAAGEAKTPGYCVSLALGDNIIRKYGMHRTNDIGKEIAARLNGLLAETLPGRAVLYRTEAAVFLVLVQPGPAEPVRAFVERAGAMSDSPWKVDGGEYACSLDIAATPLGVALIDPDAVNNRLDAALVENAAKSGRISVFFGAEQ